MPIPTVTASPVTTPAPAMRIVVTANDGTAALYSLSREYADGSRELIRGSHLSPIVGAATALDIEHPFDVPLKYVAQTYTSGEVFIGESVLTAPYTAVGYRTWLADPMTPSAAVNIEVVDWPDWTKPAEGSYVSVVGSADATVVYGGRSNGSGQLVLHARTAAERNGLRGLLAAAPTILVRTPGSWDVGVISIGVPSYTEKRLGLADNPARLVTLEVVRVSPVDPNLAPVLHDYNELSGFGYLYSTLSGHVGLTYLDLAQNPAGL